MPGRVATFCAYWPGCSTSVEQRAELHLAPGAARLDVGQHALQIADAGGERLHLAQPLVHLLQALRHLPERFAEPLLERRLQLLVDGRAHLLELLRVLGAQHVETLLERTAQRVEPRLRRLRHLRQAIAECLQLACLRMRGRRVQLSIGFGIARHHVAQLLPQRRTRVRCLVTRNREILPNVALVVSDTSPDRLEPTANLGGVARRRVALPRKRDQSHERHRRQRDEHDDRDERDDRDDPADVTHWSSLASGIERKCCK